MFHVSGDVPKVLACKMKPYKLIDRDNNSNNNRRDSQVMEREGLLDGVKKDTIEASYIKIRNSECCGESSIFVVKLTVSDHSNPDEIKAKKKVSKLARLLDF